MLRGLKKNVIVDIPAIAHSNKSDLRVWIEDGEVVDKSGRIRPKVLTIGKAFSEKQMYPNENFIRKFPRIYAEAAHTNIPIFQKRVGLYAVVLSIGESHHIYQYLIDAYGIQYANVIVDFGMYMILSRKNTAELYPSTMKDHVLFSGKTYSDEWLSEFFEKKMTNDATQLFKKSWIQECHNMGIIDVWVCADGSNNDCDSVDVEDAEQGHNKSGTNKNIYGYFFVVNAADGMPITFERYRGGRVDCSEINEIIDIIKGYGFRIKGFILDRGFATIKVIEAILRAGYAYIIMMKNNCYAQKDLFARYANEIRMTFEHCVNDEGTVFGVVEHVQLFSSHPYKAYVGLYYDSKNGCERASYLIKKIRECQTQAIQDIENGKEPSIPNDLKKYFVVEKDSENKLTLSVCLEEIHKAVDQKGYSAIATSENISAEELYSNYHLRDVSEEEYSIFKSQLGEDVTRVHHTNGSKSKLAVGFITSIYRFFIMNVSIAFRLNTNRIVRELDMLTILQISGDNYTYSHTALDKQIQILSAFDVSEKDLEAIAQKETVQERAPERNPVQAMPSRETEEGKGRRGRKKGSKNKKTIERERREARARAKAAEAGAENVSGEVEDITTERRGRGRPKGSKNKKTLAREAQQMSPNGKDPALRRGKGRPPGSKNKKTIAREAEEERLRAEGKLPPKRGRGRPSGSKNKKTIAREAEEERLRAEGRLPPKRGPGRPKKSEC